MSRHIISPENARTEIAVGFDAPLNTFFAQVIELAPDDSDQEDNTTFWIGTSEKEITDVQDLATQMQPFLELSDEIKQNLVEDSQREEHHPTALQRQMLNFFAKKN